MDLVVDLAHLGSGGVEAVGGKAVNLTTMQDAGLPVPEGFCLTTAAYRASVGDCLDDLLVRLVDAEDPAALAECARQARERVLGVVPAATLDQAVLDAYQRLGSGTPVAVRSSATAEDLAYASFAGQQDTYLNVIGGDALLDAVRRCWASLWTERAVSYRTANGIDHRRVALAVVVQRMVDATAAGVMFTANPVTGTRTETVIDASPGLGESVVSGAVNPDHFVVDRTARAIVRRRLGDKRTAVLSRAGGGVEYRETGDHSALPCLTDREILTLNDLGERVQTLYGAPQDTEWALDADGRFWLTQARPITTLYPQPRPIGFRHPDLPVPHPGPRPHPADHADGAGGVPTDRILPRRRSRPPPAGPSSRSSCAAPDRPASLRGRHARAGQSHHPPPGDRHRRGDGGANGHRAALPVQRRTLPARPAQPAAGGAERGAGRGVAREGATTAGDRRRLPHAGVRRPGPAGAARTSAPHPPGRRDRGAAPRPRGGHPRPRLLPDHAQGVRVRRLGTAAARRGTPAARPRGTTRGVAHRDARAAAQRDHGDGSPAVAAHRPDQAGCRFRSRLRAGGPGHCGRPLPRADPASGGAGERSPASCVATGIARWPRSTWGCPGGRRIRRTSSG